MQKFSNLLILPFLLTTLLFESGCVSHQTASSSNHENGDDVKVEIDKGTNSFKKSKPSRMKEKPFFDWPVVEARMSRGFLPKVTRKRKRPHKGIDLAAQRGTAVMAAHDGMVIYTGKEFKGYGKMLMIEKDGWATLYGHLDKIIVYEGQKVKQGDVVGALGNTGRSSGPHLHFEIRKADGPIDPLPYLPAGEALTNDVDNGAEEY